MPQALPANPVTRLVPRRTGFRPWLWMGALILLAPAPGLYAQDQITMNLNVGSSASAPAPQQAPNPALNQLPPPNFNNLSIAAIGVVNQDGAQIVRRAGPASMQVLYTCPSGLTVGIAGQMGEWYCILMADNTLGCILAERVTVTWLRPGPVPDIPEKPTAPSLPFSDGLRENRGTPAGWRVVDNAMRYLGVRYRWGGNTEGGIDCSGLVKAAFKQEGISLPRTAREQHGVGMRVSRDEIQPGDRLSFVCKGSTVDHTGIYIGNGQFIHASGGAGQVVISPMEKYERYIVGIHRDFR